MEKIRKIEEEIKNLYISDSDEKISSFWFVHVKPVIDRAKNLAEKYGADKEIVWLAAILHDIGQLEALESHEEIGAKKAYEIMLEKGYKKELAEKVSEVILTHRVNQHKPENLEQKILATADAMSHFSTPHYLWLSRASKKPLLELFEKLSEKIERDYNQKIFFEDERKMVEENYKMLKNWFENKNLK